MSEQNHSFEEIGDVIAKHKHFVLLSHVRPDADAIGSQLGLAHPLKALGKKVTLINEDGVPESLAFLPGSEWITQPQGEVDADVVIALDTATQPRLGANVNQAVAKIPVWVNIDHHITNPRYGQFNHIDSGSPATGEILVNMIHALDYPLAAKAAESLFAAISTDTGSFQFPNTTANTYRIAADLIDSGVHVGDLSQKLYESFPYRRIELLRELLNSLTVSADGRVASWSLTQETVQRLGLVPDDSEGLIDHIRSIDSVIVAVFFEELSDGKIRVSSRSKSGAVNVGKVCSHFGGGGHTLAAGARMAGNIIEAETKFLKQVYDALEGNH
jgi:phosphoesterase RecJ-like protein